MNVMNLEKLKNLPKSKRYKFYRDMYREWFSNYLTLEKFSTDYCMSTQDARMILDAGKMVEEQNLYYD